MSELHRKTATLVAPSRIFLRVEDKKLSLPLFYPDMNNVFSVEDKKLSLPLFYPDMNNVFSVVDKKLSLPLFYPDMNNVLSSR